MSELRALNTDAPQSDRERDRLGFAPHATRLARAIANHLQSQRANDRLGLTMSIEGEWGAGKTTYLNFVRQELKVFADNAELILVDFDPWWLADKKEILLPFLQSIMAALPKGSAQGVRSALVSVAKASRHIPDWLIDLTTDDTGKQNWIGKLLKIFRESGGSLETWMSDTAPRKSRDKVGKAIRDAGIGVVVFIDDMDRLEGEEALQVLRLIKSIGDLPNVVYLTAFSPSILHEQLGELGYSKPEAYLEKIIQARVMLPVPAPWRLRNMLAEALSETVDVDVQTLEGDPRFEAAIVPWVLKPRDIGRLNNNISIALEGVRNDVDLIDFCCVESIRTFDRELYTRVRRNRGLLTDSVTGATLAETVAEVATTSEKREQRRREELLLNDDGGRRRQQALAALFPRCPLWPKDVDANLRAELMQRRSVALSQFFDTYFTFEIAPGALSREETEAVFTITDENRLVGTLLSMADVDALDYVLDSADALLPETRADRVLLALYRRNSEIVPLVPVNTWQFNARLTGVLARRLKSASASFKSALIEATSHGSALTAAGSLAWTLARMDGALGPQRDAQELEENFGDIFSTEEKQEFKGQFVSRMWLELTHGDIRKVPAAPRLLRTFAAWAPDLFRQWAADFMATDTAVEDFIGLYNGYAIDQSTVATFFGDDETYRRRLDEFGQRSEKAAQLATETLERTSIS